MAKHNPSHPPTRASAMHRMEKVSYVKSRLKAVLRNAKRFDRQGITADEFIAILRTDTDAANLAANFTALIDMYFNMERDKHKRNALHKLQNLMGNYPLLWHLRHEKRSELKDFVESIQPASVSGLYTRKVPFVQKPEKRPESPKSE